MENLINRDLEEFATRSSTEREALGIVLQELHAWNAHDLDTLLAISDQDIIYHDVTLPPAKGPQGLRAFGAGWITAAPDFSVTAESIWVQGRTVVTMGRIAGTIQGPFFGRPAPNKPFECMFAQVAIIENGQLKYVRDHWDFATMMRQMGWPSLMANRNRSA